MNITVTLDATPALLDAINNLAAALKPGTNEPVKPAKAKKETTMTVVPEGPAEPAGETPSGQEPAGELTAPVEKPTAKAATGEKLTIESIRKMALVDNSTKERARKVLAELGVKALKDLAEDQYPAFKQKFEAAA